MSLLSNFPSSLKGGVVGADIHITAPSGSVVTLNGVPLTEYPIIGQSVSDYRTTVYNFGQYEAVATKDGGSKSIIINVTTSEDYYAEIPYILPSGYTEVECIKATNTQWINANFSSTDAKIEIKVGGTVWGTSAAYWFGDYTNEHAMSILSYTNANTISYKLSSSTLTDFKTNYDNSTHTFVMDKTGITMDGTSQVSYSKSCKPSYFGLFAAMNSTTAAYNRSRLSAMDLYYCKLWDNGVLARDFVPCIRTSDSEVGLYDLVSQSFFSNSGTGVFIAGDPV